MSERDLPPATGARSQAVVAAVIVAAGAAGALAIRFSNEAAPSTLGDAADPPPVVAATARDVPLRTVLRLAGRARARRAVDLTPEAAGRLLEVRADVGDVLAAATTAFRLDDRDATFDLAERRARLDAAEARALQAARRAERRARLGEQGVHAPETVEEADLEQRVAAADLEVARRQVALAERALEKLEVQTPWPGKVVARLVDPGAWVLPGQPVLRLLDLARLDVRIHLPAGDAVHLRPGDPATVRFAALPGETFPGRLRFIAAEASDGDLQFPAAVEIPGEPRLAADLVAEVELELHRAGRGVAVPIAALDPEPGTVTFVWVIADGRLRRRQVVVASTRGGSAILQNGLEPGERVLVSGPVGIQDGLEIGAVAEHGG